MVRPSTWTEGASILTRAGKTHCFASSCLASLDICSTLGDAFCRLRVAHHDGGCSTRLSRRMGQLSLVLGIPCTGRYGAWCWAAVLGPRTWLASATSSHCRRAVKVIPPQVANKCPTQPAARLGDHSRLKRGTAPVMPPAAILRWLSPPGCCD